VTQQGGHGISGAAMSRRPLFLVYGLAVGVWWATVVNRNVANTPVAATIWGVVLAIFFGVLGWRLAGSSKLSSKQLFLILLFLPVLPLVFLASMFGMGVFFLLLGVMWPFFALQGQRRERQFRKLMKSKGRFIAANDIHPRLAAGIGTLIMESTMKGVYRIWWTEDDLSSLGEPVSIEEEVRAIIQGQEHHFNSRCRSEYLDDETGRALLTSIPARYARSGKLARMFPAMKVATVVRLILPKKDTSASN
jgi:hypothetical protein